MPSKERKQKELKRAIEKQQEDAFFDNLLANAPDYIKNRLFKKSQRLDGLKTTNSPINRIGVQFDSGTGDVLKQVIPDDLGANSERKDARKATAVELREKHKEIWGRRGVAKKIAHEAGLSVRTVQKYMKDFTN